MTRRQLRALRDQQVHEATSRICAVAHRPARAQQRSTTRSSTAASQTAPRRAASMRSTLFRSPQAKAVTGVLIAFGLGFTTAVPAYAVSPSVSATVDLSSADYQEFADREAELVATGALEPQALTGSSGLVSATDASSVGAEARAVARLTSGRACTLDENVVPEGTDYVIPLPAGSYTVTSRPGARWGRQHNGVDMAAPYGTTIVAAMSGTVISVGLVNANPTVQVRTYLSDGTQIDSFYLHETLDSVQVKEGDTVRTGDVIAAVASEGQSTGNHLHFEMRLNGGDSVYPGVGGETIDGLNWLSAHGAYVLPGCA